MPPSNPLYIISVLSLSKLWGIIVFVPFFGYNCCVASCCGRIRSVLHNIHVKSHMTINNKRINEHQTPLISNFSCICFPGELLSGPPCLSATSSPNVAPQTINTKKNGSGGLPKRGTEPPPIPARQCSGSTLHRSIFPPLQVDVY